MSKKAPTRSAAPGAPLDAPLRAAWIALIALALLHALAALLPDMWWWGLNLNRFLPPGPAWVLWGLTAVTLLPPAARVVARGMQWAGDLLADRPLVGYLKWGLLGAALAWYLPDQIFHVGDFLMRLGSAMSKLPPERVFPQALGLDVALHYHLVNWMTAHGVSDAYQAERITGAVAAGLLGLCAAGFARSLALRGVAADAVATLVLCGGTLGLFTGYGKGLREMVVVTAALGVFAVRVARDGRGLVPFALALAVGLLLHRSALFLVPVAGVIGALAWRAHPGHAAAPGATRPPSRRLLAILLVPLAALAANVPRIWKILVETDVIHLKPVGADQPGILGSLVDPVHLADLLNVALLLSPACLLIPALLLARLPAARSRVGLVLAALAGPLVAMLLFVHPRQGIFRDWDVFGAPAMALTLVAAWLLGEALRDRPAREAWVGAAAALAVLAPTLQWLLIQHEFEFGTQRVRAFALQAPRRPKEEVMMSWEYLGVRYRGVQRLPQAEEAYQQAAQVAPIGRILFMLALIQSEQGKTRDAQSNYRRVTENTPQLLEGWAGLATTSMQIRDLREARRALEHLLTMNPGNPAATKMLGQIEKAEAARGTPPAPIDSTAAPRR